jgi:hypothetical protein
MTHLFSARTCLAVLVLIAFFLTASTASAVDIADVQAAVADETPMINMSLRRPGIADPIVGTVTTIDWNTMEFVEVQSINIQAYFDTGASGILLSKETASSFGIQSLANTTFTDVGVGGNELFDVSEPLYADLGHVYQDAPTETAGSHPQSVTAPGGSPLHIQIGRRDPSWGETPLDVVGMPAMAGKVVVIDPKPLNSTLGGMGNPDDITSLEGLRTYVYSSTTTPAVPTREIDPGVPLTNHHISLSYGDMSNFTMLDPSDGQGPTLNANPFIGPNPVVHDANDKTPGITVKYTMPDGITSYMATGSYLLDTGSQGSVISTAMAAKLHIRYTPGTENTENAQLETFDPDYPLLPGTPLGTQFATPMGGIGSGQAMMAGFNLDWLLLPTVEALNPLDPNDPMNIRFLSAPVFVSDISLENFGGGEDLTLDGVFGMNFLMASMSLDMTQIGAGAFDWIVFDESGKQLGLTVIGETVPEPGAFVLLTIGVALLWLRRFVRRGR